MSEIKEYLKIHGPAEFAPLPMVTPYLPQLARKLLADHERQYKKPGFILAMDRTPGGCKNCGGGGSVYIRLCDGGPYQTPFAGKAITYFDGNEIYGRGWYTIKETNRFDCPECHKEEQR